MIKNRIAFHKNENIPFPDCLEKYTHFAFQNIEIYFKFIQPLLKREDKRKLCKGMD